MPRVTKNERYVEIGYELNCGFERATALANNLCKALKDDFGLFQAKDDTRGWDGDRKSLVVVTYETLADANRLDQIVRGLLSLKVDYNYKSRVSYSYGSRCATARVDAVTEIFTN